MTDKATIAELPERIWLQLGYGDEGSHTWCAHPVDEVDLEEVEYIRKDVHDNALESERAKNDAMHEAIEVYALPLIWALKCDGKLADGTTAEKVLRAVATPPYMLPTPPETTEGKRDE